jgi:hypothetical protein
MIWFTEGDWTPTNYAINLNSDPFSQQWYSKTAVLSGDGSLICVYAYNTANSGPPYYMTVTEVNCVRYAWGEASTEPIELGVINIANIDVQSVTMSGIPAGMTANGGVQMISVWDQMTAFSNGTYISYNGGLSWEDRQDITSPSYQIHFSPDGSYTTQFNLTTNNGQNVILQAYTPTPVNTVVETPFTSSDPTQWPSAYQPDGPPTVQAALDIIAKFMNTYYGGSGSGSPTAGSWSDTV